MKEPVAAIIRWISTIAGTLLVARGIIDSETLATATGAVIALVGAVATLAPIVWSVIAKIRAAKETN